MRSEILAIITLCNDYIQQINHKDFCNVKWSTAEVISCWVIASRFLYGNIDRTRKLLIENKYINKSLTLSALMKRIHRIPHDLWTNILKFIEKWKNKHTIPKNYLIDSFPIAACHNIRIDRCRLFQGESFRGYNASKKMYFYGLKATVITTIEGCPVRVILCPAKEHDNSPFKIMDLNLPRGSCLYGDAAYQNREHQKKRWENEGIRIIAARKTNSREPISLNDFINLKTHRKKIETTFSMITNLMPRKIHAVTSTGFELKILGFILAVAINFVIN